MTRLFDSILKIIKDHSAPISTQKLKNIVESYSFVFISEALNSEKNPDIYEKMKESEIISICSYSKGLDSYFLISFEKIIIFVCQTSISFVENLFLSHPKLTICFYNNTKSIFDSNIKIKYEETNLNIDYANIFQYIKSINLSSIFTRILTCILQYLIKKSFNKLN